MLNIQRNLFVKEMFMDFKAHVMM